MTRRPFFRPLGEGAAVHMLPFCFVVLSTPGHPFFKKTFSSFSYRISVSRAHDGHMTFVQVSRNVMRGEHCVTPAGELHMAFDRLAYKSSSNFFTSLKMFSAQKRKASWIDFHSRPQSPSFKPSGSGDENGVLRFSFPVPVVGPSAKD